LVRRSPRPIGRLSPRAFKSLRPAPFRGPAEGGEARPKRRYTPRDPERSLVRELLRKKAAKVQALWSRYEPRFGPWRKRFETVIERFFACGMLSLGFSLYRCDGCGHELKLPFSCKTRFCPSCVRKRMTRWSDWLTSELLLDLPHRQWVLTVPVELRRHFAQKRWLLNKLSTNAARLLMRQMRVRSGEAGAVPGVITVVQTAGDDLSFNPHVHAIATTCCLGPSGKLHKVDYIPYVKLSRIWKSLVLSLLRNTGCITSEESDRLWRKYPNGFNLNGEIADTALDPEASRRLAEYILRPPMAEHRVLGLDLNSEEVRFRARGPKDRKTGRRPPIVRLMDFLEFAARLIAQIPPRGQKLVNYYGLYSNKVRGMWKKNGFDLRKLVRSRKRRRGLFSWRSQLWRLLSMDPLECPSCGEELLLEEIVLPASVAGPKEPP